MNEYQLLPSVSIIQPDANIRFDELRVKANIRHERNPLKALSNCFNCKSNAFLTEVDVAGVFDNLDAVHPWFFRLFYNERRIDNMLEIFTYRSGKFVDALNKANDAIGELNAIDSLPTHGTFTLKSGVRVHMVTVDTSPLNFNRKQQQIRSDFYDRSYI